MYDCVAGAAGTWWQAQHVVTGRADFLARAVFGVAGMLFGAPMRISWQGQHLVSTGVRLGGAAFGDLVAFHRLWDLPANPLDLDMRWVGCRLAQARLSFLLSFSLQAASVRA